MWRDRESCGVAKRHLARTRSDGRVQTTRRGSRRRRLKKLAKNFSIDKMHHDLLSALPTLTPRHARFAFRATRRERTRGRPLGRVSINLPKHPRAMRGTTPDGFVGKIVGFLTLLAVLPLFSLSLPLSFVFGRPSVWGFRDKYRPSFSFTWSKFMTSTVMGCNLTLVGNRGLHKDGRCVYLCNHRAWADFFIDVYLTEGRAFILSRYLVVYVFPLFALPAMAVGAVFAFKRNKPGAHEALNAQLDTHRETHGDFR